MTMFKCASICLGCLEFHSSNCVGLTDTETEYCPEFFSQTTYRCELRKECPQARGVNPCFFALAHPGPMIAAMCEHASIFRGEPTVVRSIPTNH